MTTAKRPIPRGGVLDINAYVPGRSEAPGAAKMFKLSSNETPLGPSAKAVEAFRAAGDSLAHYPDGASTALRQAIGKAFGLDPTRIVHGVKKQIVHIALDLTTTKTNAKGSATVWTEVFWR